MNFYNHKNQMIGEYNSSLHVFIKTVRGQKSTKRFQGWALEVRVIDTLDILDCKEVQIKDKSNKYTYSTAFNNFPKNGTLIRGKYGDKILVTEKYWQVRPDEGNSKN